jgi:hypothetical protein
MVLKFRLLSAALVAVIAVVVMSAGGATAGSNNPPKDCINSLTGQKEGTFTWTGPVSAWPRTHKYVSADISLTDNDGQPVGNESTVSAVGSHDQTLEDGTEMNGSGHTPVATDTTGGETQSGEPTATTRVFFRAERSGHKLGDKDGQPGRTYTFTVEGTTDNGLSTCNPVTFKATVPHDLGKRSSSSKTSALQKAKALRARTAR